MPIAAVQPGEVLPQELEELFLEHCQMLHRTAYAITGHRQDAEDVLQSIFVNLLQRGMTRDVTQHPARYLHRAAVNLSLNVLRTRQRRRLVYGIDTLDMVNGLPQGTPRSFAEVRRGEKPTCGVYGGPNGPNWVSVAGEGTLDALTQELRSRLAGGIGVTNKTGMTDKFNWYLEFVVDASVPGVIRTGGPAADDPPPAPRATIFDALEQQLGLRLEPVQVPRTYLVIDAIEKPDPN
jgi:hypothetical protein